MEKYGELLSKPKPKISETPKDLSLTLDGPQYIKNTLSKNIPKGPEYQYLHGYINELSTQYGNNKEYLKALPEAIKKIKQTYNRSFDQIDDTEKLISAQSFLDYLQSLPGHENKTYYNARLKLLFIALAIPKTIFENPKKPSNLHIGKITTKVINDIEDDDTHYARKSAFNSGSQELCILFGDENGNITPELLNTRTEIPTTYLKSKKSTH